LSRLRDVVVKHKERKQEIIERTQPSGRPSQPSRLKQVVEKHKEKKQEIIDNSARRDVRPPGGFQSTVESVGRDIAGGRFVSRGEVIKGLESDRSSAFFSASLIGAQARAAEQRAIDFKSRWESGEGLGSYRVTTSSGVSVMPEWQVYNLLKSQSEQAKDVSVSAFESVKSYEKGIESVRGVPKDYKFYQTKSGIVSPVQYPFYAASKLETRASAADKVLSGKGLGWFYGSSFMRESTGRMFSTVNLFRGGVSPVGVSMAAPRFMGTSYWVHGGKKTEEITGFFGRQHFPTSMDYVLEPLGMSPKGSTDWLGEHPAVARGSATVDVPVVAATAYMIGKPVVGAVGRGVSRATPVVYKSLQTKFPKLFSKAKFTLSGKQGHLWLDRTGFKSSLFSSDVGADVFPKFFDWGKGGKWGYRYTSYLKSTFKEGGFEFYEKGFRPSGKPVWISSQEILKAQSKHAGAGEMGFSHRGSVTAGVGKERLALDVDIYRGHGRGFTHIYASSVDDISYGINIGKKPSVRVFDYGTKSSKVLSLDLGKQFANVKDFYRSGYGYLGKGGIIRGKTFIMYEPRPYAHVAGVGKGGLTNIPTKDWHFDVLGIGKQPAPRSIIRDTSAVQRIAPTLKARPELFYTRHGTSSISTGYVRFHQTTVLPIAAPKSSLSFFYTGLSPAKTQPEFKTVLPSRSSRSNFVFGRSPLLNFAPVKTLGIGQESATGFKPVKLTLPTQAQAQTQVQATAMVNITKLKQMSMTATKPQRSYQPVQHITLKPRLIVPPLIPKGKLGGRGRQLFGKDIFGKQYSFKIHKIKSPFATLKGLKL